MANGNGKKSNSVITTAIDVDAGTLTFNVIGAGELRLALSDLSQANRDYAALHGMKQRIADAAAIPRDEATGKSATPQDKFEAMAALVAHYASGAVEWSVGRRAGGGAAKESSLTLAAMQRVWPDRDCGGMVFKLETKRGITRREAYAEFAKTREVAAAVAAIKAERATVSADDLLDEMED